LRQLNNVQLGLIERLQALACSHCSGTER
jgi:hypothetical protein